MLAKKILLLDSRMHNGWRNKSIRACQLLVFKTAKIVDQWSNIRIQNVRLIKKIMILIPKDKNHVLVLKLVWIQVFIIQLNVIKMNTVDFGKIHKVNHLSVAFSPSIVDLKACGMVSLQHLRAQIKQEERLPFNVKRIM